MKKFDDQFLAKTDKYLPNFYIIKLQAPSSHVRCSIHIRCSSYISSVQEIDEDSIEFSLSTQIWRVIKLSGLSHYKWWY